MTQRNRYRLSLTQIQYFDGDGVKYNVLELHDSPHTYEWFDTDVTLSGICNAFSMILHVDSESIPVHQITVHRGYSGRLRMPYTVNSFLNDGCYQIYSFSVQQITSINLGEKLNDSLSQKLQ